MLGLGDGTGFDGRVGFAGREGFTGRGGRTLGGIAGADFESLRISRCGSSDHDSTLVPRSRNADFDGSGGGIFLTELFRETDEEEEEGVTEELSYDEYEPLSLEDSLKKSSQLKSSSLVSVLTE